MRALPIQELRVLVLSWNVNSKHPKEDFHELLGLHPDYRRPQPDLPDVYVLGYQEAPIPPSDLVLDSTWVHSMKCLLAKYSYVMIKHIRIQGILSCVFIRRSLLTFLRNVEVNYTRTGFGGLWGNKGGVSIRMTINGYNICFVNCHLAAHDNKIERRIQDYHDIIYTQNFKHLKTPKILNHDYVIISGDLNFRLNDLNMDEIRSKILEGTSDSISELLLKDQLSIVKKEGKAFVEFSESIVSFLPTYKFKVDTNDYDMRKRKPAFTDRILFKRVDESDVRHHHVSQAEYRSHPTYCQSDHKPVTCIFRLNVSKARDETDSHFIDPDQIASDSDGITEPVFVEFHPVTHWTLDQDNQVLFRFTDGSSSNSNRRISSRMNRSFDWIGVYRADFSSLDDWITYIWADEPEATNDMLSQSSMGSSNDGQEGNPRVSGSYFTVTFPSVMLVPEASYVLIYFSGDESLGILGMSHTFISRY